MRFAQFYFSVKDVEICISAATEQSAIYCKLERNENNIKKKKVLEICW